MVISPSLTSYFCILKTEIQIDTKKIIIRGEIMNKQHLIALDLDGTLLTDNKIISTRTETYNCKKQRNRDILLLFQQDVHSVLVMITIKNLILTHLS